MSWSTKEKAFCVEAYFANNSYKVVQVFGKLQYHHTPSKSRIFDWMQKFRECGTVQILIQKVWGILILFAWWMVGHKETLMLYGIRSAGALKNHGGHFKHI